MKKLHLILIAIVAIIVIFMASTLVSPILIVCEDTGEDASIDMAATFSLAGLERNTGATIMHLKRHRL